MNPELKREAARIDKELKNERKMTNERPSAYSLRKRQKKIYKLAKTIEDLEEMAVDDEEYDLIAKLRQMHSEQFTGLIIDNL